MEVASCRFTGEYGIKIFQIPRGTKRPSLSQKLKISADFLKMKLIADIYSEFSKIFRSILSRVRFCLNISWEITVHL